MDGICRAQSPALTPIQPLSLKWVLKDLNIINPVPTSMGGSVWRRRAHTCDCHQQCWTKSTRLAELLHQPSTGLVGGENRVGRAHVGQRYSASLHSAVWLNPIASVPEALPPPPADVGPAVVQQPGGASSGLRVRHAGAKLVWAVSEFFKNWDELFNELIFFSLFCWFLKVQYRVLCRYLFHFCCKIFRFYWYYLTYVIMLLKYFLSELQFSWWKI